MNPDKLFDYLDGRLLPTERTALEERLMSDKQLQRELAVARQIHAGMHGDSREIVLPPPEDISEQGRKMATRIGVAFMVLVFVNIGIGLWFIFRHESKNPNRPLLERQMREQIAKSIERAAALTPAPNALGVTEITIPAKSGKLDAVADKVVAIVSDLGGSATKGVPDAGRLSILVDLPANRESEFRAAVASILGGGSSEPSSPITAQEPGSSPPATVEKKSFVVQIVEGRPKSD
jgi:anti-sigma factor RsiW